MPELPISYHTFLFPFIWNDDDSYKQYEIDDFVKILDRQEHWIETSWEREEIPESGIAGTYGRAAEWAWDYATFQYFTPPARKLVFGTRLGATGVVARNFCFQYKGESLRSTGKYIIKKKGEEISEVFTLDINGIRLKIFNTGIAILIFELEYAGDKLLNGEKVEYASDIDALKLMQDINKINEYGRRISLPFIGTLPHPLVADEIHLRIGDIDFAENFSKTIQASLEGTQKVSLTFVMKPIQNLLECGSKVKITSNRAEIDDHTHFIHPVIDDRMFVCCLLRSDKFVAELGEWQENGYRYLKDCREGDHTLSDALYALAHIETGTSCQSRPMKEAILKQCVYDRWIDWGTMHLVTHHSFLCLTGAYVGLDAPVIFPFLTQYVELAVIALAQRATILSLCNQAARLANSFRHDGHITLGEIIEIARLEERYVKAQNQILLFDVTAQEQGVELFEKLQQQLYVEKNKAQLDRQLHNLYEISNMNNDRLNLESREKNDKILFVLAIVGTIFAASQTTALFFPMDICWGKLANVAVLLLSCVGLWLYHRHIKDKKKRR
jgi:hypothetical protein